MYPLGATLLPTSMPHPTPVLCRTQQLPEPRYFLMRPPGLVRERRLPLQRLPQQLGLTLLSFRVSCPMLLHLLLQGVQGAGKGIDLRRGLDSGGDQQQNGMAPARLVGYPGSSKGSDL